MARFILTLAAIFLIAKIDSAYSNHIRAGDIAIKSVNTNSQYLRQYEFTLTLYRYTEGIDQPTATLNFGDNTCETQPVLTREIVGDEIEKLVYKYVHSYPGDGSYLVSFFEEYRNHGINNISFGAGFQVTFYIETLLVIDAFNGINNTPILAIPPIDEGAKDKVFTHNPGAYDPDKGDSLSFEMTTCKAFTKGEDGCNGNTPIDVPGYALPNDPYFGGLSEEGTPATFTLDSITGDMEWNTPGKPGEYNVAFIVREWRKINGEWVQLGYVLRDMQITVKDTKNNPPQLAIPKDTCVVAGSELAATIKAEDPDGDAIFLSSYSELYSLTNSPATFSEAVNKESTTAKPNPVSAEFTWSTNCNHIRRKPYQVNFKAKDLPGSPAIPRLTDIESWRITVVGPAPESLIASSSNNKTIDLHWGSYTCANADSILIYRKVGPYNFTPGSCEVGIPEGAGYELIGKVKGDQIQFTDDTDIKTGLQYCYRIVASFPLPGGGLSYASNEACTEVQIIAPVITNVTVDKTNELNGQITVKWIRPLDLNTEEFKGPYEYKVFRSEGINSEPEILVKSFDNLDSLSFVDKEINTKSKAYSYKIKLNYNEGTLADESDKASSVRLNAEGTVNSVSLTWTYKTPWINNEFYIYRKNPGATDFLLIDSTSTLAYKDIGKGGIQILPGNEYCYYIITKGSYANPRIPSPLINYSQVICQIPGDSIAPCSPVLTLAPIDCDVFRESTACNSKYLFNTLSWTNGGNPECQKDIAYYKIYYSPTQDKNNLSVLVSKTTDMSFLHKNNELFFAGCYSISSVDQTGNESVLSEMVCNDNCPYIEFPNIITPNGDGKNETFAPFDREGNCPWFVKSIDLLVVNRWGNIVYDSQKNKNFSEANPLYIAWNGYTHSGKELATGVYFYTAKVRFISLDPQKSYTYKGWIQILR